MSSEERGREKVARGLESHEAEGVGCGGVRGGIREHGFDCVGA